MHLMYALIAILTLSMVTCEVTSTSKSQKQNVDSVQHNGVSLAEISRDPVHHDEKSLASRYNVTYYTQQNVDRHRRAKNDTDCEFKFTRFPNHTIPNLTSQPTVKTLLDCKWMCMRNKTCVAIDWNLKGKNCSTLHEASKLQQRVPHQDIDHFWLEVRCALPTCKPNPCKNGGKCSLSTSGHRWFECACPSGYKGSLCQSPVAAEAESSDVTLYIVIGLVALGLACIAGLVVFECHVDKKRKREEKERRAEEERLRLEEERRLEEEEAGGILNAISTTFAGATSCIRPTSESEASPDLPPADGPDAETIE